MPKTICRIPVIQIALLKVSEANALEDSSHLLLRKSPNNPEVQGRNDQRNTENKRAIHVSRSPALTNLPLTIG